ncbi:MAG: ABC transporter permease [Burkholderiaceae bacterium]
MTDPSTPFDAVAPAMPRWTLWAWQWLGLWRQQRGRAGIAIVAIAIGVALAVAIHLVNASALDEFGRALAVVNGEAQWQVLPTGGSFDEDLYARLAGDEGRRLGITAASPVIDVRAVVPGASGRVDDDRPLRLIGIDLYRAARVTPALLPRVAESTADAGSASPLFGDDTIFVSASAQQSLGARVGDTLRVRGPNGPVSLRISGDVGEGAAGGRYGGASADTGDASTRAGTTIAASGASGGSGAPGASKPSGTAATPDTVPPLAVMDIGALQWRLGWLGRLNRIDLRIADGVDAGRFARELAPLLGRDARLQRPQASEQRMSNLSRAYRVNLGVLSLVALFTGAFIVYATLALSVTRQRTSLAMLTVIGLTRRQVGALVHGQGLLLGAIGSLAGLALGIALAAVLLARLGGDLGGGYFIGTLPTLTWSAPALLGYWLAGVAAGAVGSWWPMRSLDRQPVVARLRGAEADPGASVRISRERAIRTLAWPLAWLLLGALLLQLPPVTGLPIPAYAAIAAWLFAGIAAVPMLVTGLAASALRLPVLMRATPLWLACQRLGIARFTAVGTLSGVVASFALASAMAIMVTSFRGSVEHWLGQVLPADLYTRSAGGGARGAFDDSMAARLRELPGIARAQWMRATELTLDAERAPVAVLARPIDAARPASSLPMTGEVIAWSPSPADAGTDTRTDTRTDARTDARTGIRTGIHAGIHSDIPIYVSEAMVDLYRMTPGTRVELPLGPAGTRFLVRGVWRDYARQFGAIAIDDTDYRRLTGDDRKTDVAVWLADGADAEQVLASIRQALPELAELPWRSAAEIRALSLSIFDRSFVVTYLLEAIALGVGLFGVAATFAGESVSRGREFGLLRQLGVERRGIAAQLAIEAALLLCCGVAWGLLVGLAIAWVLIDRVNPQSFHWTMDLAFPTATLAISALVLVVVGTLTAAIVSRHAAGQSPVRAVRADW